MSVDHQRLEIIFQSALELPDGERDIYLAHACAGAPELRSKVERLLRASDRVGQFLTHGREDGAPGQVQGQVAPPEPGPHDLPEPPTVAGGPLLEGPGAVIGRYKLLEKLGEGGFGAVYVAEQREPVKRRVALKLIKLGMDTRQVVARFEAERQALALMDHPHIAKVLDAGAAESGRPYFVMELVRGLAITRYCDENKLPIADRLALFIQVCQAIQHAHQKGIIHRDIKPSNILVTLHDGVAVPKVIDFGIAKATQGDLTDATIYTQFQQFVGTPAYMSPEQAEMSGLDIDTRSDIYSLGVLLYELLTGETPFDAKELLASGVDQMRRIIRERDPVRPSTRLTQHQSRDIQSSSRRSTARHTEFRIDPDLDWIVMKALEKDRTRRYETANGLAADLKRHLEDEPVTARPPSAAYRFRKAWRRNRILYTASLIVALALLGGVVGTLLSLFRAERESRSARAAAHSAEEARGRAQASQALAEERSTELKRNLYFSQIALAHRESISEPSNVKLAEQLLDLCSEPMHDWEWHYLKRRRFAETLVLKDPGNKIIHSVAFSSDGRLLAAGGGDRLVTIWDISLARPVQTLSGHDGFVASVSFNPAKPNLLASAGSDQRLVLWDWPSAKQLHVWPAETSLDYGLAYAVAFSPDGVQLAAPGTNNDVIVRNTVTGQNVFSLTGHEMQARCVAFSPNGHWIATGGSQGDVHLWDAITGKPIARFGGNGPPMAAVAFVQDSTRLLGLHFDGTIRVWSTREPVELLSYRVRGAGAPSVGLAVHPTSDRLVTGGLDRVVTLTETSAKRQVLVFRDMASGCYSLAFSPDGTRLAAGSRSGNIYLWNGSPLTGAEEPAFRTLNYPGEEVWAFDVLPNGRSLAAGGFGTNANAPVMVWSSPGFDPPRRLFSYDIVVFSLAYHPSGRFVASSGDQALRLGRARVKIWDLESGRETTDVEAFAGNGRLFTITYSPDGRWLLGAGNDKSIKVWDATSGRKVGVLGSHEREITKIVFSLDGRQLASIGNDDVVRLWDGTRLTEAQTPARQFPGLCGGFTDLLAFSPDSTHLAVTTDDETVTIHDLRGSAADVHLIQRGHRPLALAFSPDGRWLASGGVDCTVRLWDPQTGILQHTFRSHKDQVTRLKFYQSPEGPRLVSSSRDGTLKFWDLTPFQDHAP